MTTPLTPAQRQALERLADGRDPYGRTANRASANRMLWKLHKAGLVSARPLSGGYGWAYTIRDAGRAALASSAAPTPRKPTE